MTEEQIEWSEGYARFVLSPAAVVGIGHTPVGVRESTVITAVCRGLFVSVEKRPPKRRRNRGSADRRCLRNHADSVFLRWIATSTRPYVSGGHFASEWNQGTPAARRATSGGVPRKDAAWSILTVAMGHRLSLRARKRVRPAIDRSVRVPPRLCASGPHDRMPSASSPVNVSSPRRVSIARAISPRVMLASATHHSNVAPIFRSASRRPS